MDISSLRERRSTSELTVTELNAYIKRIFDADRSLAALSVRGEISNLTIHRSGHLYFSLKDSESQIRAVMFRSAASGLRFVPENGMKVIVRCSVSVYVQNGAYQLYVNSIVPDGVGELYLAYEQLKSRLEVEGLFSDEYKKPIPTIPLKIGVITSPTGAAVRDIINIIGRRFPMATIYLYPSLVQGEAAAQNLIKGIDYFEATQLADVIIIGRGGGSIEDLWAFNNESLARRIFASQTPIISAVGHETDFTICDFVADLRAPTPSAAAELAVPDTKELMLRLDGLLERCYSALTRSVERAEERLYKYKTHPAFLQGDFLISERRNSLASLYDRLTEGLREKIDNSSADLKLFASKLDALSPLATLSRGYSVASRADRVIRTVDDIDIGDKISVRLIDGTFDAEVTGVNE